MLNSYANSGGNKLSQSLKINAVSGSILKNHPKSWFMLLDLNSIDANEVLAVGGHKARIWGSSSYNPDKDIIVLQMMMCGEMKALAECIYRKDYEANEGNS